MIRYTPFDPDQETPPFDRARIARFLHRELGEFGDPEAHIAQAIAYACGDRPGQGGLVLLAHREGDLLGAAVVNDTGMGGYIPEHILVYIAVARHARGQGIGKELMRRLIARCPGGIALHVEPSNPARRLYEALGFTSKYLEMRLQK